jgi:chromosome segregation ATPase
LFAKHNSPAFERAQTNQQGAITMHKKDTIEKLKEQIVVLKAERKNLSDIVDHLRFRVAELTATSQELRKTVAQKEEEIEWQSYEIDGLNFEIDGLKDDKKAMAQIMEERFEQSAQTVRDLTEIIESLRKKINNKE